jgi:hypothetical protein
MQVPDCKGFYSPARTQSSMQVPDCKGFSSPAPPDRLLYELNPSNLYNDYPRKVATVYK